MNEVTIHIEKREELAQFLSMHDFVVEEIDDNVYRIQREDELPVYVSISETNMYFEVDLGNVSSYASTEFYFKLLDLNTEILPVSFGFNNTNPDDPRLVLVESRDSGYLNDHELLGVFDALELAADRASELLTEIINN